MLHSAASRYGAALGCGEGHQFVQQGLYQVDGACCANIGAVCNAHPAENRLIVVKNGNMQHAGYLPLKGGAKYQGGIGG